MIHFIETYNILITHCNISYHASCVFSGNSDILEIPCVAMQIVKSIDDTFIWCQRVVDEKVSRAEQ
jgi:hypothetical protein